MVTIMIEVYDLIYSKDKWDYYYYKRKYKKVEPLDEDTTDYVGWFKVYYDIKEKDKVSKEET